MQRIRSDKTLMLGQNEPPFLYYEPVPYYRKCNKCNRTGPPIFDGSPNIKQIRKTSPIAKISLVERKVQNSFNFQTKLFGYNLMNAIVKKKIFFNVWTGAKKITAQRCYEPIFGNQIVACVLLNIAHMILKI